jgi:hypothetical protein
VPHWQRFSRSSFPPIDGNPIEDLKPLINPKQGVDLVMKNGGIYKNNL